MGKFTQGILGKTRGKIDGVVIQRFRVGYIDREKVIPRNPRTSAQVKQRARFATMSALTKAMRLIAAVGFAVKSRGTMLSPSNWFAKANFPVISSTGSGGVVINYPQMVVADGSIGDLFTTAAPSFDNPSEVAFVWSPTGMSFPLSGIAGVAVVYCPDFGTCVMDEFSLDSTGGTARVSVPSGWAGLRVHVYAFSRYTGESEYGFEKGDVSRSMYVGAGVIG